MAINMALDAGICGHDTGVNVDQNVYEGMTGITYDHPIQERRDGGCGGEVYHPISNNYGREVDTFLAASALRTSGGPGGPLPSRRSMLLGK
jgi:hypothetical protein